MAKIVIPGLNRGIGVGTPGRVQLIGRGGGRGPAQLVDLPTLRRMGVATKAFAKSVLASVADGDILANISGASAVPIGNTLSDVLDHVFTAAEGDILYRDSAAWKVLAPSTAGYLLQTNGAGAVPSWVAPPSSSGHKFENFGALPATSAFTGYNMQTGSAFTATSTSLLLSLAPNTSTYNIQGQFQSAPASTPWDVYARIEFTGDTGSGNRGGLAVKNNSTNKLSGLVMIGSASFYVIHDTGPSTPGPVAYGPAGLNRIRWFRVNNDGTNLNFYVSSDGANWLKIFSETIAAWVGSADLIGLYGLNSTTAGLQTGIWCGSFGTTAPS